MSPRQSLLRVQIIRVQAVLVKVALLYLYWSSGREPVQPRVA